MNRTLAIVIENYVAGGSDAVANQLARHLTDWEVVVFTNKRNDVRNLVRDLDSNRVTVVAYGWKTLAEMGEFRATLGRNGRYLRALLMRGFNLAIRYPHILFSALYFARLFKHHHVDVIVSNNGGYPGGEMCRAAVLGARLRGLKAVMIVHSLATRAPFVLWPMEKIMDALVGRCARFVAVGDAVARELANVRSINQQIMVIDNAVERPTSLPKNDDWSISDILCIGAISHWKDQIRAVSVYRALVRKLIAKGASSVPTLTLIGPVAERDYKAELDCMIAAEHIEQERIVLTGYADAHAYFARPGQLLLLTSNVEGLPIVLLEAMSYGVPAVCTSVGGVGSVISDGVNGRLHETSDVEGLAESLYEYVCNPSTYRQASQQCLAVYDSRYAIDRWVERYRALLNEFADRPVFA